MKFLIGLGVGLAVGSAFVKMRNETVSAENEVNRKDSRKETRILEGSPLANPVA